MVFTFYLILHEYISRMGKQNKMKQKQLRDKGLMSIDKDRMIRGTLSGLWDMADMFHSLLLQSQHKDCLPTLEKIVGRFS